MPKLAAAKEWRRREPIISEGWLRRQLAAERVYQIMWLKSGRNGRKPSQKQAIGIVREETGMAVSKIKLGLREYRDLYMELDTSKNLLFSA
ncbi:MAG: hypothetical protein KatS3mg120_2764 [Erythrobacter sp.]|nr:MAG: hypothetical protein KatS3mg120_2764 [Erythrobacter sp.]